VAFPEQELGEPFIPAALRLRPQFPSRVSDRQRGGRFYSRKKFRKFRGQKLKVEMLSRQPLKFLCPSSVVCFLLSDVQRLLKSYQMFVEFEYLGRKRMRRR
jgi:hypothetical protein